MTQIITSINYLWKFYPHSLLQILLSQSTVKPPTPTSKGIKCYIKFILLELLQALLQLSNNFYVRATLIPTGIRSAPALGNFHAIWKGLTPKHEMTK